MPHVGVELRPDVIEHALLLSLRVGRGDLRALRIFGAAQPQLAAGDDLLRDEAALRFARSSIDANLFAGVADHRIEGQPRLILRSLQLGIRLDECRVVRQRHPSRSCKVIAGRSSAGTTGGIRCSACDCGCGISS